ncbi:MAG: DUF2225 domain-containing protein [Clostridiaceae bacterium]|nr:DUF2225 domain-containing protein [Clostridiaceae bacterium]
MDKNLFAGLEDLGIDNINNIGVFKKADEKVEEADTAKIVLSQIEKEKIHIYDKEVKCPVCESTFKVRMVKSASPRVQKKDGDFYIKYDIVNPYFYDVWICNNCGYSSMKVDFNKIKEYQKALISTKITSKWQGKSYPEVFDVNIAIERYKLALYNSVIMEAASSRKAMNCLKIAWMYRLNEDKDTELVFLTEAIEGFNDAFINEATPLYGMDDSTLMYLIGELYRRVGDSENANIWFSKVISGRNIDQKIKEMARTQKDFIKEVEQNNKRAQEEAEEEEENTTREKKGFFSRFFSK